MDWKQKVDERQKQQAQEAIAREIATKEAARRKAKAELAAKYKYLATFRCCVCKAPSQKPYKNDWSYIEDRGVGRIEGTTVDWSKPGDLWECTICHKWACEKHFHNDVCQTCAEKM